MTDLNRNIEAKINKLLQYFPVVIVTGVRQCGKTTLAKKVRPNWYYVDLERASDFDRVTRDFDFFFKQHSENIIIDEAQCSPDLFRELRSVIDNDRKTPNRFLLTGSSSLELIKNVSESLAGRVGIVELGTFKMNETYQTALPAFYNIFQKKISKKTIDQLTVLKSLFSDRQVMTSFLKGGYPEPFLSKKRGFYQVWMDNYFETYIKRDVRSLFPRLDITKYQRFVSMLSSLSGTIINKSEIGRSLDTTEVTIRDYLDIAHGSFIWRIVPSYEKSVSKSVVKMPKGCFRDVGLSHYLQKIKTKDDLDRYPFVGASFESFVTEELIKGLQAALMTQFQCHYYRTKNGVEVDIVLTGDFGVLPVEIKYGSTVRLKQVQSLIKFVKENSLPLGIVINNSDQVEMISDKIIQIPATMI